MTQLRSRWTAPCTVEDVANFFWGDGGSVQDQLAKEKGQGLKDMSQDLDIDFFSLKTKEMYARVSYNALHPPWPLAARDLVYTNVYCWTREGAATERSMIGWVFAFVVMPHTHHPAPF